MIPLWTQHVNRDNNSPDCLPPSPQAARYELLEARHGGVPPMMKHDQAVLNMVISKGSWLIVVISNGY